MIVMQSPGALTRLFEFFPGGSLLRRIGLPQRTTRHVAMALPRGAMETIPCGRNGLTIRGLSGSLWVTVDGETRDVVLRKGDETRIDRCAKVILDAVEDCSFELVV